MTHLFTVDDFRVRKGDEVELRKWPTVVKPVYKSTEHYQELLAQHIARLSILHLTSNPLPGCILRRAVKIYSSRCEELEKILGLANDAVVTKRLALSLVSASRPDLAKPAGALVRWNERRGRKALQGFKPALKEFRAASAFWS